MVDTVRTTAALQALLANNTVGDVSPQDLRDMLVSLTNKLDMFGAADAGWIDILGNIDSEGVGPNDPNFNTFIGNILAYEFRPSTMMEVFINFHIGHDYLLGSDVLLHAHWATIGTAIGTCRWGFEYTIAKGHAQATGSVFPATTTVYAEEATDGIAFKHRVTEISATIPTVDIEPDSIIMCRVFRDAAHANDTLTDGAFLLKADCHTQVDRLATLNRSPNFYA